MHLPPSAGRYRFRATVTGPEASAAVPEVLRVAGVSVSLGGRQVGRMAAHSDGSYAVDAPGAGSYVLTDQGRAVLAALLGER